MSESKGNAPTHKVRMYGVEVAVWKKDGERGVHYNMQVSKSYKDGGEWKSTNYLDGRDALFAAEALRQASAWVEEDRQTT